MNDSSSSWGFRFFSHLKIFAWTRMLEALVSHLALQQPLPSGKLTKNYGKSSFLMGNSTISMAIFNSFLLVYQRVRISVVRSSTSKKPPQGCHMYSHWRVGFYFHQDFHQENSAGGFLSPADLKYRPKTLLTQVNPLVICYIAIENDHL